MKAESKSLLIRASTQDKQKDYLDSSKQFTEGARSKTTTIESKQ